MVIFFFFLNDFVFRNFYNVSLLHGHEKHNYKKNKNDTTKSEVTSLLQVFNLYFN